VSKFAKMLRGRSLSIGPDLRTKPRPEDVLEADLIPYAQTIALIRNCPRCNEPAHKNLIFKAFKDGPAMFDGTVVATHWALCPVMKEPLFRLNLDEVYV
jgi:hypothetical protein